MNRLEELKEKALQGDVMNSDPIWASIEHNSEAIALMFKLSENTKSSTRSIAISCLNDIENDPKVIQKMLNVLTDPVEDIRHTAVTYLNFNNSVAIVPQLIPHLDNSDTIVRGEIALILGNIKDPQALLALKERSKKEPALSVQKNIMLARAKLGDREMKENITKQLSINDSKIRFQALEDLKYIDDKTLAYYFLPALNDKGNTYQLSNPGKIPIRYMLVCDLAINMIAAWYPGIFSFKVDDYTNYSQEEIEQAKKFVASLKKP